MKTLFAILGLVFLTACTDHAALERQARYQSWYQSLTPEQQEREDQRQHERSMAAMQALGMMNMGRGVFGPSYTPSRIIRPPVSDPMPLYQPRQRMNCTSNRIGSSVYTDCY